MNGAGTIKNRFQYIKKVVSICDYEKKFPKNVITEEEKKYFNVDYNDFHIDSNTNRMYYDDGRFVYRLEK